MYITVYRHQHSYLYNTLFNNDAIFNYLFLHAFDVCNADIIIYFHLQGIIIPSANQIRHNYCDHPLSSQRMYLNFQSMRLIVLHFTVIFHVLEN